MIVLLVVGLTTALAIQLQANLALREKIQTLTKKLNKLDPLAPPWHPNCRCAPIEFKDSGPHSPLNYKGRKKVILHSIE